MPAHEQASYNHNLAFLRTMCPEATEIARCYYVDERDWIIRFYAGEELRYAYIERIDDTTTWKLKQEYIP